MKLERLFAFVAAAALSVFGASDAAASTCGNGICEAGEDAQSCSQDCQCFNTASVDYGLCCCCMNDPAPQGDAQAGVTVISLAQRMDAGLVYAVRTLPVGPRQTAGELHDALSALGPEAVESVLAAWMAGTLRGAAQDESQATRARKLGRADAWVDLSMDGARVRARINGLNPWPGCAAQVEGRPLLLRRCEEVAGAGAGGAMGAPEAGTLDPDGTLWCGRGAVRLLEVQAPGGRAMEFTAWARGIRLQSRATLRSAPVQEAPR